MKEIELTQGKCTTIDSEDWDIVNLFKWSLYRTRSNNYVATRINGKLLLLHRLIANAPLGMEVDHINSNGLDNRPVVRLVRFSEAGYKEWLSRNRERYQVQP